MSLDVSLIKKAGAKCECPTCGQEYTPKEDVVLYSDNITHNLGQMAGEAHIYHALWRPEENFWSKACDIIPVLKAGLADLKAHPEHYKNFDSPNGWGKYEHFVPFVENYLNACIANPDAEIEVSR